MIFYNDLEGVFDEISDAALELSTRYKNKSFRMVDYLQWGVVVKEFCKGCQREVELRKAYNKEQLLMWACVECDRWIRRMTEDEEEEYAE